MEQGLTESHRWLKTLVVVMGVLIVTGLVVVVVTVANRATDLAEGKVEPAQPEGGGPVLAIPSVFGEVVVTLPEGSRLRGVTADSGRLYLRLEGAGRAEADERILVIDAATGRRLGDIRLEHGGSPPP